MQLAIVHFFIYIPQGEKVAFSVAAAGEQVERSNRPELGGRFGMGFGRRPFIVANLGNGGKKYKCHD